MQIKATSPEEYIDKLPDERKAVFSKLRETISQNLPSGFIETMNYGMVGYVIPFSIYSSGYHAGENQPLPFINIGSQKNFIALYHMGIYANNDLLEWFKTQYPKHCKTKLDMGKSCIRFKNMDDIPFELIGELSSKMTTGDWIEQYEKYVKR